MSDGTVEKLDLIDKETGDAFIMEIKYDSGYESPREWDNQGTMLCWHRRYTLGDENSFESPDDYLISLIEKHGKADEGKYNRLSTSELIEIVHATESVEIMPLYLYDHSGLTISTNSFGDPWDSGQVGWISVDRATIEKNYNTDKQGWQEIARQVLKGEVAIYDTYLRGDVYGFVIEKEIECQTCHHVEMETIDSCWEFYGDNWQTNGLYDNAGIGTMYTIAPSIEERAI